MQTIFQIFKKWLPLAIITAGLCGLVYITMQQSLRIGANDPQIQIAEDNARALNAGVSIESLVPTTKVEIADSLAPFLLVFDDSGKVLASSATLHGSVPAYPVGVLDNVRQTGEERVTWQPETGVRMATVVTMYNNGFVMAGRSLREVEKRIDQVGLISGLALAAIWAATLLATGLGELVGRKKKV